MPPAPLTPVESAALNITRAALLAMWQGRDKSLDPMDALLVATIIQANVDPAWISGSRPFAAGSIA